jgi:hemerythrin-like metal-binding protein
VKSIDDQHTVLFNTINDLHAAMMKGQARAKVGEMLCTLLVYTRNHFSDEERIMENAKYSGLAAHRVEHRKLTKQVEEYISRYQQGDLTLSLDLADFLSDWLKNHIQSTDQSYRPWLNEHGVR